ncbi:MAG: phosphoribosyltransferase [Candidatus Njordarchaeum guaymaensis]
MVIKEDLSLRNKFEIFKDRSDAGQKLAVFLKRYLSNERNLVILAIPRGGIPVGCIVARELNVDFDIVVVRKIPIPWDPEAGFGAVTPDGETLMDENLARGYLGLDTATIRNLVSGVLREIKRREVLYRGSNKPINLKDKKIIIIDDGLATGYTMFAAINYVRKQMPKEIMVAVPTASERSIYFIDKHVNMVFCLNIRSGIPYFAVADAYVNWRDLTDNDVLNFLRKKKCFNRGFL